MHAWSAKVFRFVALTVVNWPTGKTPRAFADTHIF